MDTHTHLVLLKGKDKTAEIQTIREQPEPGGYTVAFKANSKAYAYTRQNVDIRDNAREVEPASVRIVHDGRRISSIKTLVAFAPQHAGGETWWRVFHENGKEQSFPASQLDIQHSALSNTNAKTRFAYLRELAGLNEELVDDDGTPLLKKNYERLTFVDARSALAAYLAPEMLGQDTPQQPEDTPVILPFGGNESQLAAVRNALSNQMSLIQGPPGTGKTQTILNILANVLLAGKTAIVVSNNNTATKNVYDKMASAETGLDFLVAQLGRLENKEGFLTSQTGAYPDMTGWAADPNEAASMRQRIGGLVDDVQTAYAKQTRRAQAKRELAEIEHEAELFGKRGDPRPENMPRIHRRGELDSRKLMRLVLACEQRAERHDTVSPIFAIRLACAWRTAPWACMRLSLECAIATLHQQFYKARANELLAEVLRLEEELEQMDASRKLHELTRLSTKLLRNTLHGRYAAREHRPVFASDDLWRNGTAVLREYPIVTSTAFSATGCLGGVMYDYIIVDEASQLDVASGALALSCARNAVVVGDDMQLPPVIDAEAKAAGEAARQACGIGQNYSLGASFLKSMQMTCANAPCTLLREHYRCHPDIIGFCNRRFYDGQLIIMTDDAADDTALVFVETVAGGHSRGHTNRRQLDVLEQDVLPQLEGADPGRIGIITPYRDQVRETERLLARKGLAGVKVSTVHGFQGQEKDVIVLMTVDDTVTSFSDDTRLVNVAVSRAKKQLILIASANEQPRGSNIASLIGYMRYQNHDFVQSGVVSVFDLLYREHEDERKAYLRGRRRVSEYDSENLMHALLEDVLAAHEPCPYAIATHYPLRLLVTNTERLDCEQLRFSTHPNTHVDFLVYDTVTKAPVLAVEVDGVSYHREGTRQHERDVMKDEILRANGIRMLRCRTDGSGERGKLEQALFQNA